MMTVQTGPFAGMQMHDMQTWGNGEDIGPQLLGVYEQELHTQIQTFVARHPTTVINVGCAEGYYAIGLARLLPHAQIFAFDIDRRAQEACLANARLNGVADRIRIAGECTPNQLEGIARLDQNILAIIDCEGAESSLLGSQESLAALASADLIVEGHDYQGGDTLPALRNIYRQTHRISTIVSAGRNPHAFPFLDKCSDVDKWLLVCENRPRLQNWLICQRRGTMHDGAVMQIRHVNLAIGRTIPFKVQNSPGKGGFFVLGVRKSGSTIFNRVCQALAEINGYKFINVAARFFQENVTVPNWVRDPAVEGILAEGNVYGTFRNLPWGLSRTQFFAQSAKVLLVRDPRDAIVSEYFTNAYSHSIPKPTQGGDEVTRQMEKMRMLALAETIDDAVIKSAPNFNRTMLDYEPMLEDKTCGLLKYENVILNKRKMIDLVCGQFGWTVTDQQAIEILSWADIVPVEEDKTAFIRKVVPGDHVSKLRPETVALLNEILKPSMDAFGYDAVG